MPWPPLYRMRRLPWPTAWGWALTLALAAALSSLAVTRIHPFLAQQAPVGGEVLVAEGWLPDYALRAALARYRHGYRYLAVTGGPVGEGAVLAAYPTLAARGAAVLRALGADSARLLAAPARIVRTDRTYASALALRDTLAARGLSPRAIDLVSLGPHARRSRLLFAAAFGPGVRVGVVAVPDRDYDPRRWWRYSAGFRTVVDEVVAYAYALLLFRPPAGPGEEGSGAWDCAGIGRE